MAVSLLGGKARGFSLKVVSSPGLRPTSVILRRKIFDRFQNLCDHIFIDACAGSGSMGLEAFSRGAEKVYFVEANKKYFSVLKENLNSFAKKYSENEKEVFSISLSKVQTWLGRFKNEYETWSMDQRSNCIFFFDPPYNMKNLYEKIVENELLKKDWFIGDIWVESDRLKGLPKEYWEEKGFVINSCYEHSDSYLIIIENSL